MNDAPAAARDALMDVLERALPPLYTDLSGLRSIADAILVSGLVVPASVVAAARRDALEEAAALIDRGYLDASVRMDPKRDHSVSDWFRRQQAAARAETERVKRQAAEAEQRRTEEEAAEKAALAARLADEAHRVSIQVEIQNAISELTEDILEEEDAAPVEVALLLTLALMRGEIPHVEVRF